MTTISNTSGSQSPKEDVQALQEALRLGLAAISELWFHTTTDWVTSVHAADIDGDGDYEVLVGSRDGSVRALTRKGQVKWQHEESCGEWVGSVFAINAADALDRVRVITGARDGAVVALNDLGKVLWSYRAGQVIRRIRVLDINRDGRAEVLIASEDCSVHALACDTGELLWKYDSKGWIRSVFAVDIDNDGEAETLAASGDRHLYVLDCRGELKYRLDMGCKIYTLWAADLDNDGEIEILYGSDDKDLCAMKPDGRRLWQVRPENRIHSINVADLNNDGRLEIIAASEDEHIYFLDDQGNMIWKHFLGHRIDSVFGIDLNRDGIWEVVVGAEDNNVHVLRVELPAGLLSKIKDCYQALGRPHPSTLSLTLTERRLLEDLIRTSAEEYSITLNEVEQMLAAHNYYGALSDLLMLDEQRVQILWTYPIEHTRSLALYDTVDPRSSYFAIATHDGDVSVFNADREMLWTYHFDERIRMAQVADVDLDGRIEVVVGLLNGYVYLLDSEGKSIRAQTRQGDWIECMWIMRDTTSPQIVLCSRDNTIRVYDSHFSLLTEPIQTPQSIRAVCTYDLDNDGQQEIIAGALDGTIYVYRLTGEILWTLQVHDRIRAFCVKDVDRDGQVEILVGSEDRNIYVLDRSGQFIRWRYQTFHRVLDVDAIDADHDGQIEIFAGATDGRLYVLSQNGGLLWRFQANDRIRVMRTADINHDGKVEILLGSEDRLYMLQILDRPYLHALIERCWQALLEQSPFEQVIQDLLHQSDAHLRAFALARLATTPDGLARAATTLQNLFSDDSMQVKQVLISLLVPLYRYNPQTARLVIEKLSTDREREIRLSLIHHLPDLCICSPQLVFEYLDRFTHNVNIWIRRSVVRKLDQLAQQFPDQVFPLLLITIFDQYDWIRQESARAFAHYLDIHVKDVLKGVRLLITKELDIDLFRYIIFCATHPLVKSVFHTFLALQELSTGATVLEKLRETVEVLAQTRLLQAGEIMYRLYHELYRLHNLRTIEGIAQYKCTLNETLLNGLPANDSWYFTETLHALHHLETIITRLGIYLRREGLGERISSLLDATTAIDALLEQLSDRDFSWSQHKERIPDYLLLQLLLENWRKIVTTELTRLRGKADLQPGLQTHKVYNEECIGFVLNILNVGRSPADNVRVILHQDASFTLSGPASHSFETISTHEPVQAEFSVQPLAPSLSLHFTLIYDDAEAKERVINYGDRLELIEHKRSFQRLHNPYYTGTPIQDQHMFYGREEELAILQEDFVYSSANTVVVLYGQRRSGKSSLLFTLIQTSLLDPHIPVHIDMQEESINFSINRFLYMFSYRIYRALRKHKLVVNMPQRAEFDEDPAFALDLFLEEVETVLQQRKLVILIDEFEVLEEKVKKGELDADIFAYLRSLMQGHRCMHFLLAGTHTIKQLTAGYWSVFFNIAKHRRLSRLTEDAARQLITRPLEGQLDYDVFAIEKIRQLAGDQPFLIQNICHSLVQHCNVRRKNYVTINDVNIVLEEVMRTGTVYFSWIWDQAEKEERILLSIIAQEGGDEGQNVSLTDIERVYRENALPYRHKNVLQALRNLLDGDFIVEAPPEDRFKIPVGLTRTWLRKEKPLQRVIVEENLLDLS
ncbi:MAG: PQQ-binding-like beta-propeller repeat protein [Ktedonobacteraceae bacterium]|nr:PQQ-binding-like beta-propeller repeat protein [Ktedonobacteraceae bacterium]